MHCDFPVFSKEILTKFNGIPLKACAGPGAIIAASTHLYLWPSAYTLAGLSEAIFIDVN